MYDFNPFLSFRFLPTFFVIFVSAISLDEVALLNVTISLSAEYRVQSDQGNHVTLDYSSKFYTKQKKIKFLILFLFFILSIIIKKIEIFFVIMLL